MTPDSPKGPQSEARSEETAFELLEQTYELAERQYAEQTAELKAERDRYKAAHESTQRALIRMEAQRDELRHAIARAAGIDPELSSDIDTDYVGEVSRLREQLAAQPKVIAAKLREMNATDPDDDTMPVFWPMDDEHEGGIRHWTSVDEVARKLADALGVSSSEVEAPQPQPRHVVTVERRESMFYAKCSLCQNGTQSHNETFVENWKDRHEADTLRPVGLTNESFISPQSMVCTSEHPDLGRCFIDADEHTAAGGQDYHESEEGSWPVEGRPSGSGAPPPTAEYPGDDLVEDISRRLRQDFRLRIGPNTRKHITDGQELIPLSLNECDDVARAAVTALKKVTP